MSLIGDRFIFTLVAVELASSLGLADVDPVGGAVAGSFKSDVPW